MREDWNRRAVEDARYYVAFRHRNLGDDEFTQSAFDTGIIGRVLRDFPWLPPADPRSRRLLEIGCGLGRLMRPLSRECGEIHGVDISDEMIARARQWLAGIPHAHVHVAANDLSAFASASFDLVYSYAVFHHIPDRRFVYQYLDEAFRVLKPGGILAAQVNSIQVAPGPPDTWSGVWIPAQDIAEHARRAGWRLLSMEGSGTLNLWFTLRKPACEAARPALTVVHAMQQNGDPGGVPAGGPSGFAALYVTGFPVEACDINQLEIRLGDGSGDIVYIGPDRPDGLRQINFQVPAATSPGRKSVEVLWRGERVCAPFGLEIVPRPPLRPRIVALTDAAEVMLDHKVRCGFLQISTLECEGIERLRVTIGGREVTEFNRLTIDPLPPRHMVNCRIPEGVEAGRRTVRVWLGEYEFPPETIEVAKPAKPGAKPGTDGTFS
jgi:SAM-dependent methyltransferase